MIEFAMRPDPSSTQRAFLDRYILGRSGVVYSAKTGTWGPTVNLKGPFRLNKYKFGSVDETVLEPEWAEPSTGSEESSAHVHVPWASISKAQVSEANQAVLRNIGARYRLALRNSAETELFWFLPNGRGQPCGLRIGDHRYSLGLAGSVADHIATPFACV